MLLSSGFIAGESLMAVLLAFVVLGGEYFGVSQVLPAVLASPNALGGLVIYALCIYLLVWVPMKAMKSGSLPATHIE